jgi:hypothetical protein
LDFFFDVDVDACSAIVSTQFDVLFDFFALHVAMLFDLPDTCSYGLSIDFVARGVVDGGFMFVCFE